MTQIPRIIHQVWFKVGKGPSSPPKEYDEMRASWRLLHKNWTFMDWNLENSRAFLQKNYPQYLIMFDGYKRDIFRIDAIRYFALHYYGGFYCDTDITCLQSIEELRKHKVVLALNKYTKAKMTVHNNHFLGAVPNSAFFNECITRLPVSALLQTKKDSYISTFIVAGPFFLTTIASYYKKKCEVYTLPHEREIELFTHHEKHSWKLARSIVGDILRAGLVIAGISLGSLLIKKAVDEK